MTYVHCAGRERYTGREWALALPPGTRLISANDRLHWVSCARQVKRIRELAGWLAIQQKVPQLEYAHVLYYVRTRGRFDPGNWSPTAKAMVDGIVDEKVGHVVIKRVLKDDSRKYLLGPDPRPGVRYGFTLLIRELAGPPDD